MSSLMLRGYFIEKSGFIYAAIPSLDLSKEHISIDGVLEKVLVALKEYQITAHLTLIEGNGFTIEAIQGNLEELVLQKRCS